MRILEVQEYAKQNGSDSVRFKLKNGNTCKWNDAHMGLFTFEKQGITYTVSQWREEQGDEYNDFEIINPVVKGYSNILNKIISIAESVKEKDWIEGWWGDRPENEADFFGHLSLYSHGSRGGWCFAQNEWWFIFFLRHEWGKFISFEDVNAGKNTKYQQETPKQRVLAALNDLK